MSNIIEQQDLVATPVDIETFVKDPQYLGNIVGDGIYPYWLEQFKKIYAASEGSPFFLSEYSEVLFAGALGAGRSFAAIVGFLYELYILTLVKDPHKKWSLLPTTPIDLVVITADASNTLLSDRILDCINVSPYFKSILLPNKGSALESDMFPNHVGLAIVANNRLLLGRAIFGAIVDDSCFPQEKPLCDLWLKNISELYTCSWRRGFSRFGCAGTTPLRMWVAVASSSPLYALVDERRKRGYGIYYVSPSIWETQAFKGIYCGDTFSVFVGSDTEPPKIVTDINDLVKYKDKVIQVPVEYHQDFEKNIRAAVQELAGIPVAKF